MPMLVFWTVTPCGRVGKQAYQRFGRTCCLHLQPWKWRKYVLSKVGVYLEVYTESQPRSPTWTSSAPWEPQILNYISLLVKFLPISVQFNKLYTLHIKLKLWVYVVFEVLTATCMKMAISIIRATHCPDDGSSKYLWNAGKLLPDYTALHPRRQPFSLWVWCVYLYICSLIARERIYRFASNLAYLLLQTTNMAGSILRKPSLNSILGEGVSCSSETKHDRRTAPRTKLFVSKRRA
jgi:hypothetical protein